MLDYGLYMEDVHKESSKKPYIKWALIEHVAHSGNNYEKIKNENHFLLPKPNMVSGKKLTN